MRSKAKAVERGLLFFLVACLCLSSCGYTNKAVIPGNVKSIYVPMFKNAIPINTVFTYQAGLEAELTNAVIDRLIFDGNVDVKKNERAADAVLLGEIIRYEQEPVRFDDFSSVEEYRLHIVTKLVFKDLRTNQIIWQEDNFSGTSSYFTTDRSDSSDKVVESLAKNIVDRIVEDW